jgi:hypothetical protein
MERHPFIFTAIENSFKNKRYTSSDLVAKLIALQQKVVQQLGYAQN